MRYMGIDYGTKRVGVALSDERGSMAFPHGVLENSSGLIDTLRTIIETEKVGGVVVGHSINRDGEPNAVQDEIEKFVRTLTAAISIPVSVIEERYTTQAALRIQGRTAQTDASAAALILDSYLTRIKHST